jgi:chromosome segregation ATPase
LQTSLQQYSRIVDELRTEEARLTQSNTEATKKAESLERENTDLQTSLQQYSNVVHDLLHGTDPAVENNGDVATSIATLQARFQEFQETIAQKDSKILEYNELLSTRSRRCEDLTREQEELQQRFDVCRNQKDYLAAYSQSLDPGNDEYTFGQITEKVQNLHNLLSTL